MASAQPLNSSISVFRRVRSYRQDLRHNSILDLAAGHMRALVMSVPGDEVLISQTRDGSTDLVTTALDSNRTGLPVVRYLKPVVTLETAAETLTGLAFPVRFPGIRDVLLEKSAAHVTDDLYGELAAL